MESYGAIESQDYADYGIIIEMIDARTLESMIPDMTTEKLNLLLQKTCDCLQNLRMFGIQHVDIKPSKILVFGEVKVAGFDKTRLTGEESWWFMRIRQRLMKQRCRLPHMARDALNYEIHTNSTTYHMAFLAKELANRHRLDEKVLFPHLCHALAERGAIEHLRNRIARMFQQGVLPEGGNLKPL